MAYCRGLLWYHVCPHLNWRTACVQNDDVCRWCGLTYEENEILRIERRARLGQ